MGWLKLTTIAFSAVMISVSVRAQNTNPPPQANESNAPIGTATVQPAGIPPSERNPLLTDSGDVRIGKLIGTDIYNKNDKKVGSVDGVVVSGNGKLQIIVATGNKKVAVPWDQVQFGNAKLNSDNKVLMPGATQKSLDSMPTFSYTHK